MNIRMNKADDWAECPPGTLTGLAGQVRRRRRRRVAVNITGAVLLVLLGMGLGMWTSRPPAGVPNGNYGGIACQQVQANIQAYAQKKLPPDLMARIDEHLRLCPDCQAMLRQMEGMSGAQAARFAPHGGDCLCEHCRGVAPGHDPVYVQHSHSLDRTAGAVADLIAAADLR